VDPIWTPLPLYQLKKKENILRPIVSCTARTSVKTLNLLTSINEIQYEYYAVRQQPVFVIYNILPSILQIWSLSEFAAWNDTNAISTVGS
jgi:hypothetical protein